MIYLKLLLFAFVCVCKCESYEDEFTEELLLKPLYNEHLYAFFQFSTVWNATLKPETFQHCHLFPRALGEILSRYDVTELHLSLTAGFWRYEQWGYPHVDAPPGAELWAWFKDGTTDIDKQWKELTNSLSGLFCASLNFIDNTNSYSPKYSLRPTGVVANATVNSCNVRYASIPREIVCTENLTPWKKLLPCDSQRGLASLLNAGYIHNNKYHSLGLHFRQICRDKSCRSTALELRQTVSLVYDYVILSDRNWSFRKLFGQALFGACPVAAKSAVYVDVTSNLSKPFVLSPEPHEHIKSFRGGYETTLAMYDMKKMHTMLHIAIVFVKNAVVSVNHAPVLHATQHLTSFGQQTGSVVHKLYNNYWQHLDVVVFHNLPWYVPAFYSTLKITSGGKTIEPISVVYIPGKIRERAYHLEVLLRLPPRSVTEISVNFDYQFLKWQEYPPDANHGFYIGSSIISANLPLARNYTAIPLDGTFISSSFNSSRGTYFVQLRTEILIITLPTPDFSMPYNVICLTCTVMALMFGPMHNITTKRMVYKTEKKSVLHKYIKCLKKCIFRKSSGSDKEKEE